MIELQSQVAGYYKIEVTKPDGTKRVAADWFPNLITDIGLNRMGTRVSHSSLMRGCFLGSGNTPPAVTDIQLVSLVGSVTYPTTHSGGACSSVEPYHTNIAFRWRFNPGVAVGNLSEVGVGETSTLLFSRALILDGNGVPTTITVLPDEYIDVHYILRYYAPTADVTGTVDISGVTYDYISRAANVTTLDYFGGYGWSPYNASMVYTPSGSRPGVSAEDIVAVTSKPYTTAFGDEQSSTYIDGSLQADTVTPFGLTNGNIPGGIRSLVVRKGWGCYQIQFTPKIPKDATKTLSLTFRHSWTRKV